MLKSIGIITILLITIFSLSLNLIIIPFQTYNPLVSKSQHLNKLIKKSSNKEIIDTISRNLIYSHLEIGENKQNISIFIEMGTNEIYIKNLIIHTGLPPLKINYSNFTYNDNYLLNNISQLNYYNSSLSKSYKYIRSCPEYLEDYFYDRDIFAKEIIYLLEKNYSTNIKIKKPISFYLNFKELEIWDHRPGVIGLKIKNEFIKRLKNLSLINNYNWYINYTDYLEEKGEIIIGDIFFSKEVNLRNAKIFNKNNYEYSLIFDDIYLSINDNKNEYYCLQKSAIIIFYIEESFIIGTNEYFKFIENIFFKKYFKEGICEKETHKKQNFKNDFFYFICYIEDNNKKNEFFNNFPSIIFYQKEMNYNFTLNSKDLFTIIPDKKRILFNIVEFYNNNSNKWVLGKPFLKKYQLIFDSELNIISYYINSNIDIKMFKKNEINIKLLSFIIIITFFVGVLFGKLLLFKYNRKLKANELEDNYSYLSNNVNK